MTTEEMAQAVARMMAEVDMTPDRAWVAMDDNGLVIYPDATTGRADQVCIAAWLPWEWQRLELRVVMSGYLAPLTKRLVDQMPTDLPACLEDMELPQGVVEAGKARFGKFVVRVVVMPMPISKQKRARLAGSRRERYYDLDEDRFVEGDVLPMLRIDMRLAALQ